MESDVHFLCTPADQKPARKRTCNAASYECFKKSEKYEKKLEQNKKYKSMNYKKIKNSEKYAEVRTEKNTRLGMMYRARK